MANLNSVKTSVTIAGKACHFVHMTLNQCLNNHHTFSVVVNFDQLDSKWMGNPTKMIQMIGGDVGITMQHTQTGEMNIFSGVITNVAMQGEHQGEGYIVVSGCSPTIKLDGTPTMDSFMDLDLKTLVQESVDNSGNGGEVDIKPVFKGKIDYITQQNESCHQFLNRLSWLYGEWYGYSGTEIFFGKPDLGDAASITYDTEMTHFDFSASLIPPKVNRFDYLTHDVNEVNSDAPDRVDGVRGYIKAALDESAKIYTSDATRPLEASILSKKELDDLVKVDKHRMVSQMLTMRGRTQTCKVKIAKLISVGLPKNMDVPLKAVETFLVTQVTHEADQDGTYFNTFTAVPSEMENLPMQPVKEPVAHPQTAWVTSNADPRGRGRVQVEFQWQKKLNKTTNWIRVATPDAGSSGIFPTNRGFVFIPEEGDQVMVNFENGDPNRPYVSASIFPENKSAGGSEVNHLKTIKTRSGHMIEFNDSDNAETIRIKDVNANEILYDTRSKTITVSTLEQINLISKTIHIDASEDIVMSAGRDMQVSVGNNFTQATSGESRISVGKSSVNSIENDYEVIANRNIEIESGKNMTRIVGAKLREDVQDSIDITAVGGKTNISSKGKIEIKSSDKVNIK